MIAGDGSVCFVFKVKARSSATMLFLSTEHQESNFQLIFVLARSLEQAGRLCWHGTAGPLAG